MTDRRKFLKQTGLATVAMMLGEKAASAPSFSSELRSHTTVQDGIVRVNPADNGKALINPDMGWTMHFYSNVPLNYGSRLEPSDTADYFPGLSTVYLRLPWSFIEPEEGRFCWEILDTPAQRWIDKGKRVAYRITATENWMYSATPEWVFRAGARAMDLGSYLEPDYGDPVFQQKTENFIRAMAERYDGNPNTAFVDVGHFGMWGEGHTHNTTSKHGKSWDIEVMKQIIDIYCRHFKKSLLCISDDYAGNAISGDRFPITDYAFSRGVSLRDDSILVDRPPKSWYHAEMAQLFWPSLPVILEHEHYKGSVARGAWIPELLLQSVELYHAAYMSIHYFPDVLLSENSEIIDRINLRMGYRLQMPEIEFPEKCSFAKPVEIRSEWQNAGVTPCYGGGYPCFTLKDDKGGIVSVLTDTSLNVKDLKVGAMGSAERVQLNSKFDITAVFKTHPSYFRVKPGIYQLFVSVGKSDGTPVYELPYSGNDGHRRYLTGKIELTE